MRARRLCKFEGTRVLTVTKESGTRTTNTPATTKTRTHHGQPARRANNTALKENETQHPHTEHPRIPKRSRHDSIPQVTGLRRPAKATSTPWWWRVVWVRRLGECRVGRQPKHLRRRRRTRYYHRARGRIAPGVRPNLRGGCVNIRKLFSDRSGGFVTQSADLSDPYAYRRASCPPV